MAIIKEERERTVKPHSLEGFQIQQSQMCLNEILFLDCKEHTHRVGSPTFRRVCCLQRVSAGTVEGVSSCLLFLQGWSLTVTVTPGGLVEMSFVKLEIWFFDSFQSSLLYIRKRSWSFYTLFVNKLATLQK